MNHTDTFRRPPHVPKSLENMAARNRRRERDEHAARRLAQARELARPRERDDGAVGKGVDTR